MKFFCVIGDPISHSKSPRIHNNAIKHLGLNGIYSRFHLKDKDKLKESLFKLKLNGANITLPFKEEAVKIADFKDELTLQIGSANTLILKNHKIHAYNTDAPGFLKAIEEFKNIKKALILGAGGTTRAIAYALKQRNIHCTIANRSERNFSHFKDFKCTLYEDLKDFEFDIIINSTSAGLNDDNLPCNVDLLKKIKTKYAFEVIYGKKTPFIKFCEENNIKYKDGLSMLLWQGVFAFELFFELENKQKQIQKAMLEALNLS
ncbi:shikimate dehydrogenase [Campylobacter helveticus]|uniref:shikimate dehydrogenase n=1 Tax=Campylobacter helveticus TaxID=28898 RepID=UPI0009C3D727|nr:shikimate dehydrogenase [Campylobacter helveticus]ARE80336.1 shikimate dehydrogenase [Campylobacter helveticus]TNB61903.1 shikimate dehydrogenase [Campylobacter helveticus]TXK54292.1 shikimate dehydrogenase [Campylobacter helveticus]SMC22716.1 shikimate dehydrogenase [Campylobacter helveticus]SUW83053.1 shikimate 5-dehydrogenase [Campylobacter helveticus]